ncbi:hypothetical protein J8Z24_19465 [Pseudoalteromonas sp. SCSIO 43201]|uniref:hypothetical protein n=1 Tax=Pseudoalteromonas sp. SCSIO 43201 TaxID=2822842 RepID=UPI0020755928|nr:hypothetical protein [Pseudoalteromonas sp. SCSIO 43201]USD30315.1 hypothetical protein J8Z24_19465 [Pseudoalteromonas sp. SCSIO 43201]
MQTRFIFLVYLTLVSCSVIAVPKVIKVVDVAKENGTPQNQYFLSVLRLALDKSQHRYGEYWLERIDLPINQSRQFKELIKHNIDVFWTVSTAARDGQAQPVAIPIAFGSFGIRVLVKNVADKAKLNTHLSLSELQKFKVLLGKDWPDVEIFEKSGFTVETCMDGLTCYRVLTNSTGRVFPRGIIEVIPEIRSFGDQRLSYNGKNLLLYPSTVYFYVNKEDNNLHRCLEYGLTQALKDGSLAALFYESSLMDELKKHFNLQSASVHQIGNPLIKSKKQLETVTQLQTELLKHLNYSPAR